MEKKFTQGEWKHVNDSPYHRVELVNGRLYVASVEGALNESEEQANAKLIAAAPDLYEALELMISQLQGHNNLGSILGMDYEAITKAKAAIKKATT